MRSVGPTLSRRLVAALALTAVACAPALAEIIVLRSDVAGLMRGDILDDGEVVRLRAAQELRVMSPNGSTRVLTGPESFRVGDLPGARSVPVEAFDRAVAYLGGRRVSIGAVASDERSGEIVGGVARGAGVAPDADAVAAVIADFDEAAADEAPAAAARAERGEAPAVVALDGVALLRDDGYCFAPESEIRIARLDASRRAVFRSETPGFEPFELVFEENVLELSAPATALFAREGARHAIGFEDGVPVVVTARRVSAEALAREDAAVTLLEAGCEQQFEQFLDRPL